MRKQFLVTVKIQDISQAKRHFSEQSVQNDNRKLGAERHITSLGKDKDTYLETLG